MFQTLQILARNQGSHHNPEVMATVQSTEEVPPSQERCYQNTGV